MEFLEAVGSRRSIRWFKSWKPVEEEKIQRVLEAARLTGCPGNLQPWRAVVVTADLVSPEDRDRLLDAANRQRPHEQAPVWIYWFADPGAVVPDAFMAQIALGIRLGVLPRAAGWSEEAARAAIEEGNVVPEGMPPLHQTVHGVPAQIAGVIARQETIGAITVATLAAVNEGLGTCLLSAVTPSEGASVYEVLGVPGHFLLVWLQLLGYPAEDPAAGGQRPREPFEALFAAGRWGTPLPRNPEVVRALENDGLLQPPAPLPGRDAELEHLARMFGYPTEAT